MNFVVIKHVKLMGTLLIVLFIVIHPSSTGSDYGSAVRCLLSNVSGFATFNILKRFLEYLFPYLQCVYKIATATVV
jgi:hypothetical protein